MVIRLDTPRPSRSSHEKTETFLIQLRKKFNALNAVFMPRPLPRPAGARVGVRRQCCSRKREPEEKNSHAKTQSSQSKGDWNPWRLCAFAWNLL